MNNESHLKFSIMYKKTSVDTYIGRVKEFPEILIESPNLFQLKKNLVGSIKHVIEKNKHFSSKYKNMTEESISICA